MVEVYSRPAEFDLALAQETLGVAVAVDPAARPDSYDEKWAILDRALNIRTGVFNATMAAAARAGIVVDEAIVRGWPDEDTTQYMRQLLVRERKKVGMLDGIDSFVARQDALQQVGGTQLRWNQDDAMHKTRGFLHKIPPSSWQTTGKSGLIESATGTGKTGIFSKLTAVLKYGENPQEPVRVLIVTPRQVLLEQTKGAFAKFAPGIPEPGLYYEDLKELKDVTVMSQAAFDALVAAGKLPDFDAVIVDEAHGVGPVTDANLRKYCVDKILLGVTATPKARTRALFEHEIHRHDLRDAIQDGILAPVCAQNILAEPDWEAIEHTLPTDPAELKKARRRLRLEAWKHDALGKIEKAIQRGVGVVISCPAGEDIEFAKEYARMLRNHRVDASVREGQDNKLGPAMTPREVRAIAIGGQKHEIQDGPVKRTVQGVELKRLQKAALKEFEDGGVDVLLYVSALGIGWDSLIAKVFIDMDPSRSPEEKLQAIGRILRLLEDEHGNPIKAEVYTYIDPDFVGQYTGCDALNLKSGESIEHAPIEVQPRLGLADEKNRSSGDVDVFMAVDNVDGVVIEEVVLAHTDRDADGPEDEILTYEEAYLRSGLGAIAFKGLWHDMGNRMDDLVFSSELLDTLTRFWEAKPQFRPETLPDAGFVPEAEVHAQLERRDLKVTGIRQLAARHGHQARRYISSGRVSFYYAADDVPAILDALGKRPH